MKKSKLSLGLIACLLSVGSLAGCDVVKSSDNGVLLSYTVDGGKPVNVKADDILKEYYDDSTKYQSIFDSIYSVLKINYFSENRGTVDLEDGTKVELGKPQMAKIKADAEDEVSKDKKKAEENSDANGTSYKKEFESILSQHGVKTEEELLESYIKDFQKQKFDDNLYDYYVDEIRGEAGPKEIVRTVDGQNFTFKWNGYFEEKSPYHMSHLMVEISDSSETNYSNGTISTSDAENLYTVVNLLASGEDKFRYLAWSTSDDSSSAEKVGDLDIVDYDTGFIDEFKLGIYAYEQIYMGVTTSYKGVESKTKISNDESNDDRGEYQKQVKDLFGLTNLTDIPTVSYEVIKNIFNYKEKEKDENDAAVSEGSTFVLPRNVLYNKYLNRHAVFFIEGTTVDGPNFVEVNFNGTPKTVLCADGNPTKPIICVRGSSNGKQEIHMMVVNRSPFVDDKYSIAYEIYHKAYSALTSAEKTVVDGRSSSLEQYYTTHYYTHSLYPKGSDGKKLDTFTNFLGNEYADSNPRAQSVASKLKSFDSDKLNKYFFLKFLKEENLQFTSECKEIEKALMSWIVTSVEKKEKETDESWAKTWDKYLDKLSRQNSERKKLMPEVSIEFFNFANSKTKTLDSVKAFSSLTTEQLEEIRNSAQITDANHDKDVISNWLYGKAYEDLDNDKKLIVDSFAKDGVILDKEIEYYWKNTSVFDAFNKEGGIFNDGKAHN